MIKSWIYAHPTRLMVETDLLSALDSLVSENDKILLVTTKGTLRRPAGVTMQNHLKGFDLTIFDAVYSNPDLTALEEASLTLQHKRFDVIIALGGGSVIDTAKVFSMCLNRQCPAAPRSLTESLQSNLFLVEPLIPVIAIPTTAGTGAEVTPFATVWDFVAKKKFSLSHPSLYPVHAVLDPSLTATLPYNETLYTGLDAISHALESLWNHNRTTLSEAFAVQSLKLAAQSFPVVLSQPQNLIARSQMQQASLLAGLAISQTRTALAHSISYPLTAHFGVPHGLACSFTLPSIVALLKNKCFSVFLGCEASVDAIIDVVNDLALSPKILSYVPEMQIKKIQHEMINQERATNFCLEVDQDVIAFILDAALLC